MLPKTPPIAYPGELPDISHQTISLRTQLRLSYETYSWLRYLSWTGLLLLGLLLFLLPGGFPPYAFVQLWQTVPLIGRLVALHGSAALYSLAALIAQALTWFLLWALFLVTCHKFALYTWSFYRSRTFMASGWLPSSALGENLARRSEPEPAARIMAGPPPTATARPASLPNIAATVPLARVATAPGIQPRPFVQASAPAVRQRIPSAPDESSTNLSLNNWPSLASAGATGVAWDVGITRRGKPNEDSVLTLHGTCNVGDRLLPYGRTCERSPG
jgi:hypothetical protein